MAKIGSWGKNIVFGVSSHKILTFSDCSRSIATRWAIHNGISGKPKKELQGQELEQVTMKIVLNASLGVNIHKTMQKLENALLRGQANYLVIGGKRIGRCKYNLVKISEKFGTIYSGGEIAEVSLDITFVEAT